jgi:RNA polymerase sigma-70 factor (ECF subfamily)
MTHPTANPLVTALATGQPEGYAALYDRLGVSLFRVARTMLRDSGDAEDAVQDVFVQLVRNRQRLLAVQNLDAYVFGVLRYTVGRRIRQQRGELRKLQGLAAATHASAPHAVDDHLELALSSLPAEQREVIALKVDGDLTFAQIAEVLQVSPNTAASRYRYALEKLRRILEQAP